MARSGSTRQLIQDDDIAVIGSSNMNIRSFQLDLEVTLICYSNDVVTEVALAWYSSSGLCGSS